MNPPGLETLLQRKSVRNGNARKVLAGEMTEFSHPFPLPGSQTPSPFHPGIDMGKQEKITSPHAL